MKYNAKKMTNGNWAVFCGKTKYFNDTETTSQEKAEKQSRIESLLWHRQQMDKLETELVLEYGMTYEEIGDTLA
jgi:hypothetical protein